MNTFKPYLPRMGRENGFAVMEAIIAFVVLALGLVALLSFHGTTQKSMGEAKVQAEAVAFAEAGLHQLESYLTGPDGADARLNPATTTETLAGQLATFTRISQIANVGTDTSRKDVRVTVRWTDRDGAQQNVVLNSEVYYRDPAEGIENFMAVVTSANEVAAGPGWGVDNGGSPGDDGNPGDDTPPGDGTPPTDTPPDPVVTTYTLTISGTVSGANLQEADGIIDTAASPELVASTANCSIANGKKSFTCTVTYFTSTVGWFGSIKLTSNKNIRTSTGTTCATSLTIYFSGIKTNQAVTLSTC